MSLSEDALQTPAPEPPESALTYQWQDNSLNLTFFCRYECMSG